MSTPTNLSPEQFIEEIKSWGATKGSLIKIRMMKKGEFVFCRLILPNNGETIQTSIPLIRFEEFDFINLNAVSVPAVWEDETELIKKLNNKMEESINANTITYSGYQSIQHK